MVTLVTGGAGYIGSHMVLALLDAGEKVVVLDDLSTGFRDAVPDGAEFLQADLGDASALSYLFRKFAIDAVAHFAAKTVVQDSVNQPLVYYENNTGKFIRFLEAAGTAGVKKFVFSSTAAVYGSTGNCAVAEDAATPPLSPYGASKLFSERVLTDFAMSKGLSAAILRYFNAAGADPRGRAGQSTNNATHLIKICCEAAVGARAGVTIFGDDFATRDGTGIRDYVHVSDLVDLHQRALGFLNDHKGVFTFNVGYGRGHSVLEVIAATKRVSGADFSITIAPRRDGDPDSVVANADRSRAMLGWSPRFDDLDGIIRHALAWERMLQENRGPQNSL